MKPELRLILSEVIRATVPTVKEYIVSSVMDKNEEKRQKLLERELAEELESVRSLKVPELELIPSQEAAQTVQSEVPKASEPEEPCGTCRKVVTFYKSVSAKKAIGRATWNVLHTAARFYPEQPNEEEMTRMKNYIEKQIENYPCKECSEHGLKLLEEHPIDYSSRVALARSLCEYHNAVNARVYPDREPYDCNKVLEK